MVLQAAALVSMEQTSTKRAKKKKSPKNPIGPVHIWGLDFTSEGREEGNQTWRCRVCELINRGQQLEDGGAEGLFRGFHHLNEEVEEVWMIVTPY